MPAEFPGSGATYEATPKGLEEEINSFNKSIEVEGWRVAASLQPTSKIFERGLQGLATKQDLLLAICLNNGYYNRENIYRMLKFALAFSDRVQIFTTDGPAKHNYRAFGQPEDETIRDTRLQRNRLRNLSKSALERINADLPVDQQKSVDFLEWESIYKDPSYQASYQNLKELYTKGGAFQTDINEITRKVLLSRVGINKDTEAILQEGIEYVLEELAFILTYQKLADETKPMPTHGTSGFNYIYYESWPVFEKLVNGEYDGKEREGIGYAIAKVESLA